MAKTKTAAEKQLSEEALKLRRAFSRRSVLWPAKLDIGSHEFSCQIWNLSLGGARIRFDLPFKEGTEVYLRMPNRGNAKIRSKVAWIQEDTVGLVFQVPAERVKEIFKDSLHVLGLADKDT